MTETASACAVVGASQRIATSLGATTGAQDAKMSVNVLLNERIGTINPCIYGHFSEHIGGVIYDGIWVGPDSPIANIGGIRKDIVDWMKRLQPAVIRWPGGCFADRYHWRDGIGPRGKRPRRYGRWKDVTEPNFFGTHEFIRFCRLLGAEPYLAANVGTGSAEEFQQWVEYCNAPTDSTTLAEERAANGSPEPFGVRYWGVGNESWGCGGNLRPEDYCALYRRFATWIPNYGVPPYLVACGPNGNNTDWTARFFERWLDSERVPIHGWSPHYYCGTAGEALKFSNDQWYELLARADKMEKLITDQWGVVDKFDAEHKIRLVIDEWGAWHKPGTEINKAHLFEQQSCLRDALVAALTLDTFNRHADKVAMANIAQMVNNLQSLFLADEDKFVATPNFYVFEMYKPHYNGESVRIEAQAPEVTFKIGEREERVFRMAGSASVKEKKLTLTLVHTHVSETADIAIRLNGGAAKEVRQTVLTHKTLNAHNTFDNPNVLLPKTSLLKVHGSTLRCMLAPASVTRLDVQLG